MQQLLHDAKVLGDEAVNEVAATGTPTSSAEIVEISRRGFELNRRDAIHLRSRTALPNVGAVAGWQLGEAAARALRDQQRLGSGPISNNRLAEFVGVSASAINETARAEDHTFELDETNSIGRVVLASRRLQSRRFQLARLLGDRLVTQSNEKLRPVTKAYTYRQKVQRAFAAELLCPFETIDVELNGDFSAEAIEELADRFQVSEMVIWTKLRNKGLVDRNDSDHDFDTAA